MFVALCIVGIIMLLILFSNYDKKSDTIFLTNEEKEWLENHKGQITIGYTIDYPPVEFLKDNRYVGMSADYFDLLEEKLDFNIEMVRYESFDQLIEDVKGRKLTGITAATKTPERTSYLEFTVPYINNPNVIITRKNFSEKLTFEKLSNSSMDVIVTEGFDIVEFIDEKYPMLEYTLVKSPEDGMRMVSFGEADAMIIEIMTATAIIEKDNISNLIVNVDTPYESNLSIATRGDWPILSHIFNKGLAQITDSERRDIEQRWVSLQRKSIFENKIFWLSLLSFIFVLIVTIIVVVMWNNSLQSAIKEKTNALEKSAEELEYKTYHDDLTGLYNRVYMSEVLTTIDIEKSLPFSIIVSDLNGLKITNDTFGHEVGDQMLVKVAEIVMESIDSHHTPCRIGGDEIVIVMPRTDEIGVKVVVDKIREKLKNVEGLPIKPLIAMGSTTSNINEEYSVLFKLAEDEMYADKMVNSEHNYNMIINSIKRTLQESKYEGKAHTDRLIQMSHHMGKAMSLNKGDVDNLVLLSELHDLGKVGLDREILLKEGPLTSEEWKSVKMHPELGFKIITSSKKLSHLGKSVLAHHEHWDGNGYPQGLKGEEIPFLSRLFSIIEAYDVMTHDRPYRETFSKERAIKELEDYSGSQFDPHLVKLFIEHL